MHSRTLPLILIFSLLLAAPTWQGPSAAGQEGEATRRETSIPELVKAIPGATEGWWATVQEEVGADILPTTPSWTKRGTQPSEYFGYSVASAGDVNGDGFADVIVGAHSYDGGETDEGRAHVYHGSATGLSTTPDWDMELDKITAEFGYSVGTAGDVNGDGYSDVIIGARRYTNGETYEGAAFVYHGSPTGLSNTANWSAEGDTENAWFGFSVGTAGDVNGDGFADVIVGQAHYISEHLFESKAYVYYGSPAGLSTTADWTEDISQTDAYFGYSVGTAGDVNGDGYSDVIIGAPWYDNGEEDEGRAFVYHGSPVGLPSDASWSAESDQASAYFGTSVGTAGDVNGDDHSDVIIGAPWYDNGEENEGGAFVYHGSPVGLSTTADWSAEGDQAFAYFGNSVGTAGKVNEDGYSEALVGAYGYDNPNKDEGRAFLYAGSSTGLATTADWTTESDQSYAYYGFSVGTAGDVNGDGLSDVIAGAFGYYYDYDYQGQAYVYHQPAEKEIYLPLVTR